MQPHAFGSVLFEKVTYAPALQPSFSAVLHCGPDTSRLLLIFALQMTGENRPLTPSANNRHAKLPFLHP